MSAFARAVDLYDRGQLHQALPLFQQALLEEPGDTNVMYRAMLALVSLGDYAGCASWLQQLIPHINPVETPSWMMAGFYYNLGISYEAIGQWSQADRCHRSALAFNPDTILPQIEIGTNCYRQGKPDEGKVWHDRALEQETVDVESRPARSFLKLLRGDYLGGFAEYESRWKLPQVLSKSYVPKDCWRWKGKPLQGKKILVVGEQGIGDTILMARYIPLIQDRGGKVILVCHRTLHRLFKHNFPDVEIYAQGDNHPSCQWWCPMMSLPYVFKTTRETIPSGDKPYLKPLPELDPYAHDHVALQVGFAHKGNPLFMGDRDRSAPILAFAPLFESEAVMIHEMSEAADRDRGFKDMADTAGLVSQLDLVITVDTAIGHLVGALGVPCWLLPMTSMHWLWGMPDELTSPWYPKHRLYRRISVDAWPEAIERVKADLLTLVGT